MILLPDSGLDALLNEEARQAVIADMIPLLRRNRVADALETSVEKLVDRLGTGQAGSRDNELPDEIIEEKGV